jgi:hypothetical protein
MGFKLSWIAFQDTTKQQILEALGLRDTGVPDEFAPFVGAELPTGWLLLLTRDFDYISPARLAALSAGCRLVACQVHEGIMASGAFFYERGSELWHVTHDSDKGTRDLSVSGSPPPELDLIRRRLTRRQDEEPREKRFLLGIDYIFDVPVDTAFAICGYRHNLADFSWGEPKFTRFEAAPRSPGSSAMGGEQ